MLGAGSVALPDNIPEPAQELFHPQPRLPLEVKFLPQDTPSRGAGAGSWCRHRHTQPFLRPSAPRAARRWQAGLCRTMRLLVRPSPGPACGEWQGIASVSCWSFITFTV